MKKINTIYMLTYLFRPLAHTSKRRARFDVDFEGLVVSESRDVSFLTGARSYIT